MFISLLVFKIQLLLFDFLVLKKDFASLKTGKVITLLNCVAIYKKRMTKRNVTIMLYNI